jgi:hypothetical protein
VKSSQTRFAASTRARARLSHAWRWWWWRRREIRHERIGGCNAGGLLRRRRGCWLSLPRHIGGSAGWGRRGGKTKGVVANSGSAALCQQRWRRWQLADVEEIELTWYRAQGEGAKRDRERARERTGFGSARAGTPKTKSEHSTIPRRLRPRHTRQYPRRRLKQAAPEL